MAFHEHAPRSVIKAITYRFLIVISNGIIIYAVTKDSRLTSEITVTATIVSTILYYLHERLWNKIHWGKSPINKITR
jgi:uncharacterized membrane protein